MMTAATVATAPPASISTEDDAPSITTPPSSAPIEMVA
jgi:hypothetical protein